MGRERCWRGGFISIVNVHPQRLAFNSLPACICWSARERHPGIGSDQICLETRRVLPDLKLGKRSWGSHGESAHGDPMVQSAQSPEVNPEKSRCGGRTLSLLLSMFSPFSGQGCLLLDDPKAVTPFPKQFKLVGKCPCYQMFEGGLVRTNRLTLLL